MFSKDMQDRLKRLRSAVDQACALARQNPHEFKGAINWGDLGCVSAQFYQDDQGDAGFRVLVEEAAPENEDLHNFIAEAVKEQGFLKVEVITKW